MFIIQMNVKKVKPIKEFIVNVLRPLFYSIVSEWTMSSFSHHEIFRNSKNKIVQMQYAVFQAEIRITVVVNSERGHIKWEKKGWELFYFFNGKIYIFFYLVVNRFCL